jgi:hypothetical protein
MGKYDPLRIFPENTPSTVSEMTQSFQQVESILGFALPPSARHHRAWWPILAPLGTIRMSRRGLRRGGRWIQ